MFQHKKALYNLIQFNLQEPEGPIEPWQKIDFRELETTMLVQNLKKLSLPIESQEHFEEIASHFESPEEMMEAFAKELPLKDPDHSFLITFELWRRLLPEKRSVSIFCDELDRQINRYEMEEEDEQLQDILEYFKQILDDNTDQGYEPTDVFNTLQSFCGHNLEAFLYDYIHEKIENMEIDYSTELIEGFYPYVPDPLWFDYLVSRLEMTYDLEVGFKRLEKMLSKIDEIDLAIEILSYLSQIRNPHFENLAKKALPLLETEGDFIEFLTCCVHYFENKQEPREILEKREGKDRATPLRKNDRDLTLVKKFFQG
ncbi:MAG: hypothetical protein S4CHLAM45_12400 [Chlamydiales bacterium]|nr:hypothetical protein [Chlamydiales bacterium]MCH9619729.1 hypothetical protein [Chlamydiales bacterium]MCH9623335.1 hypothetical protein [Chlamydiales bacterium]